MGATPWFYIIPYQSDIEKAMQELQEREFQAGRYYPAVDFPEFPVTLTSLRPGAQHSSINEAREDADADGTRSILDMNTIGKVAGLGVIVPMQANRLRALYKTDRPTRQMIETNMAVLDDLERGQGVYVVLFKNERPSEILFAGYSVD